MIFLLSANPSHIETILVELQLQLSVRRSDIGLLIGCAKVVVFIFIDWLYFSDPIGPLAWMLKYVMAEEFLGRPIKHVISFETAEPKNDSPP